MGHPWLHTQSFVPCFDLPVRWPLQGVPLFHAVCLLLLSSHLTASAVPSSAGDTHVVQQPPQPHCEPTILADVPPEPYYDASEVTENAAKQLADYLSSKAATATTTEIRRHANAIATESLQQDEGLLAVAIAAPGIKLAVVQFRDHVEANVTNHAFLSTYWRELGEAWNRSDGSQYWGAPFRDCGPMQGRWLWPFSATVSSSNYKTVASAFIAADEDQCNDYLEPIFGKRHSCDTETTFCLQSIQNGSLTSRGTYTCLCNFGFYIPNQTLQGFDGKKVESGVGNFTCIPCPGNCQSCDQNGECLFGDSTETLSLERMLHVTVGTTLTVCLMVCFVLVVIVFRQRKCRTISCGMWTILEIILLGIILLYVAVGLHFLPASTYRCLIEPWCRELGFVICYGAIILKLYRHLVEFRTRKAHRWVLRDVDLLKYLGTMTFAVICYMAAFTASSLDLIQTSELTSLREVHTNTCHPQKWEYVTQVSEMCILLFGLHLAIASRNANTQFRERQFLVASILIEFVVSSSFYILRIVYLQELSPGAIFLALFIRSQVTNTVTIALVFLPKLWYQQKQGTHEASHHVTGYAGICLGDPDIAELTISEMSPEDIRAELKRLYTQLEVLKSKTLRHDNPHISKRRGGRKTPHRRFSLQALSSKHRNNRNQPQHDMEVTEAEASRTPEDSVCSIEGPTDAGTTTGGELSTVTGSNK